MYELALSEWGVTPRQLNKEWTEELLALMLTQRWKRVLASLPANRRAAFVANKVTDTDLFAFMGIEVGKVN